MGGRTSGTRPKSGLPVPRVPAPIAFDDEQRRALLDLIAVDPNVSHVALARRAGIPGTKGELRRLIDADAELQAELADLWDQALGRSGLTTQHLLDKLAAIVDSDGSPSQFRAVVYALSLRGVHVAERVDHEHGGTVEVTNSDVSSALERFNALADAAVRAATRNRQDTVPGEPDGEGEDRVGLPVGRVAGSS